MKTLNLCERHGPIIRDVAEDIPKTIISVGNLPILRHIMKYYSINGCKEFCL